MSASVQVARETDSLIESSSNQTVQKSKCCKLTYKPRRFVSKGATLILLWNFLIFASVNNPTNIVHSVTIVSYLALVLAAAISAWLADARLGRYRVVQAGLVLLWLGSLLYGVANILDTVHDVNHDISAYLFYPSSIAIYAGEAAFEISIVQFGIEQMPDASAEQITSFISWYALTIPAGLWVHFIIHKICEPFQSLLQQTLLSIVLCSHFLFKHWLINHRQTHNPLKTVYQVLKYAKQHKYPVNRSAFTYWEEEIPSRIDLGKTKYGGPFTTEQVEDVKTLLRIVVILITLALFIAATIFTYAVFYLLKPSTTGLQTPAANTCVHIDIQKHVLFNGYLAAVVLILLYEFVFYPVFKRHIPSMLKRIGLCILGNVLMGVMLVVSTTILHFDPNIVDGITNIRKWIELLLSLLLTLPYYVLLTATFEFVNAQTPDNMKGFTTAITYLMFFFAILVGTILKVPITMTLTHCNINLCAIIVAIVCAVLSIAVFVLYCFVARWYKRREREELFNARAIIEDIYSRRVEQNDTEQYY